MFELTILPKAGLTDVILQSSVGDTAISNVLCFTYSDLGVVKAEAFIDFVVSYIICKTASESYFAVLPQGGVSMRMSEMREAFIVECLNQMYDMNEVRDYMYCNTKVSKQDVIRHIAKIVKYNLVIELKKEV